MDNGKVGRGYWEGEERTGKWEMKKVGNWDMATDFEEFVIYT